MKYAALVLAALLCGCGGVDTSPKAKSQLDIHVVLDLSDRLLQPDQVRRDSVFVSAIIEAFEGRGGLDGRLTFHVAEQDGGIDLTPYYGRLQVDLGSFSLVEIQTELPAVLDALRGTVADLYEEALRLPEFTGSDVWTTIRDLPLPATNLYGDSLQSVVVVITDGYHVASRNRQSLGLETTHMSTAALERARSCKPEDIASLRLLAPRTDLHHASVGLVELRPRVVHPCELAILESVNSRWLESMAVRGFSIYPSRSDNASLRDAAFHLIN